MGAASKKLVRMMGATGSLQVFTALYAHDPGEKRPKTLEAMDDAFRACTSSAARALWAETQQWNQTQVDILLGAFFNQKRLADAERSLQRKETKTAGKTSASPVEDRARYGQAGRPQAA